MSITKLNNRSLTAVTALPSGVGGKVLQVVTGTYATSATTSSGTFSSTGLSASITPSSVSSKILILIDFFQKNIFVLKGGVMLNTHKLRITKPIVFTIRF